MSKCKSGHYYCYTDKKCKPISKGMKVTARFSGSGNEPEEVGIDKPLNGNQKNGNGNGNGGTNGGVSEGTLHKWFKGSKSKDGKGGWVNVVTGGTCASDKPGEGTPKCVSSAKRASMSKAERLSAQRRKKKADPGQQAKSGAAKPTYVSTDPKKKMKEQVNNVNEADMSGAPSIKDAKPAKKTKVKYDPHMKVMAPQVEKEETQVTEAKDKKGKGSGTKDACYHKVKSRYSVWPSAYASGALVKCRKVGAANWGNKSESMDYSNWRDDFKAMNYEFIDLIKPDPLGGETLEEKKAQKCWPGYEKKGTKKMFGKTYNNCVKKEETEITEKKDPCWDTHKQVGMKKKNGRMVPNCVPKEEFSDWRSELEEGAAWTKKSGKNPSGGLNEKGRKSYERENPGSDLKAPSKKVGNKRRASFCARMKGMKKKLTSSKTANDPDSRINKSLRAWNC